MLIAQPPRALPGASFNLQKQEQVYQMVFNPEEDFTLPRVTLSHEDLALAHDSAYVHRVMRGDVSNGFGTLDSDVLVHAVQSSESIVAATFAALTRPQRVAFAPASGFHHACYNRGGGFCTFNGLMIAAQMVRGQGLAREVLIIDGDGHWGDGTDDVIKALNAQDYVRQVSLDKGSVLDSVDAARLKLARAQRTFRPDLVLYQAGADAHIDDPYGAGYLTDEAWTERDLSVFRWANKHSIPLVWCLAGGYNGLKTLNLHNRTFQAALQVYEPGSTRLFSAPDLLSAMADIQGQPLSNPG